jgi:hypothetical protein
MAMLFMHMDSVRVQTCNEMNTTHQERKNK